MNRELIIQMARDAAKGRVATTLTETQSLVGFAEIERFAAIVAAHEREQCAEVCDGIDKRASSNAPWLCAERIRARATSA